MEVLREKHAALEQKLSDFVQVARSNDAIADRMHRFTRRLLRAGSRERALQNIEAGLRQDFDSFNSVLVLIGSERRSPAWMADVLASRDRSRAAPTHAPDGLYFVGPYYDPAHAIPDRGRNADWLP